MSLRIKSAFWMLFACVNFALLNTLVKYLSSEYSISQIIFFRSFFAIIFILPWLFNSGFSSLKTKSFKENAPNFLITSPKKAALIIFKGIKSKKEIVYVNFLWKIIMLFVRLIPEKIFKKLNF